MTGTTSLQTIWKKAVWMTNSPVVYAPKDQRLEKQRLDSVSALEAFGKEVQCSENSKLTVAAQLTKGLEKAQKITGPRMALASAMQDNLVKWLLSEKLIALGFEHPRKLDDLPRIVPAEFWRGTKNWDRSTLSHQSIKFVDIRIIYPSYLTDMKMGNIASDEAAVVKSKVKIGRPSVSGQLLRCFEALLESGKINPRNSFASHFSMIKAWLNEHNPDMMPNPQKLSDNTIRKHLSSKFNSLKD
ncbi:hypothetical protein SAMN04488515_1544 [Cognatiyoonia koreensis]|uniref:Uncharacterized protein n=1 Tax=Cognatiyoonia koreensis TaxID=364200 RepID=A0A1I0PYZ4_9RHOB|nr:hypothetical protein [Cognatiyoonia koreensis]SEW19810.1 hypothetical protein SAMN04488515_1544 [Cognatiyoonia koreensis]